MIVRIILLALAILLLTACDGGRQDSRAAANPCDQMKDDAAAVDILEEQVEDLHALVGAGGPVDPVDRSNWTRWPIPPPMWPGNRCSCRRKIC